MTILKCDITVHFVSHLFSSLILCNFLTMFFIFISSFHPTFLPYEVSTWNSLHLSPLTPYHISCWGSTSAMHVVMSTRASVLLLPRCCRSFTSTCGRTMSPTPYPSPHGNWSHWSASHRWYPQSYPKHCLLFLSNLVLIPLSCSLPSHTSSFISNNMIISDNTDRHGKYKEITTYSKNS